MFVCKSNSRRSQMAEGFARHLCNGKFEVTSTGLEVRQVDPLVIKIMKEVGIDIGHQTSKPLSDFDLENYDAVISLCGFGVNLPKEWVMREIFKDWQLEDPEGTSIEIFRRVRDKIRMHIESFILHI